MRRSLKLLACLALLAPLAARAGAQAEEPLSASVQASLQKAVSDHAVSSLVLASDGESRRWLAAMSPRIERQMANETLRLDFLRTVHYEATRAGLEPELVLGLIQVESAFRKYAVSTAGARGFMQVMPFWVTAIGNEEHNLFHLRTNLRYGCTILRHYLDIERGNLFRALGRYNGSLGQAEYPNLVLRAWRTWQVPVVRSVEFHPPAASAPVKR
ncbi:MAG TPA: lytic transglycosylase domain-containing protein [Burkholderiales bacterium]|nr:lytic transglycosylase domain-containing protein [Betaproteobacteria bacterium]HQR52002.1 lytic transglycosylase domain-containing protein [Burkholderiales bacterium]